MDIILKLYSEHKIMMHPNATNNFGFGLDRELSLSCG